MPFLTRSEAMCLIWKRSTAEHASTLKTNRKESHQIRSGVQLGGGRDNVASSAQE
jgi:hypothetical protein